MAINPIDAAAAYKANVISAPTSMLPDADKIKASDHFVDMVKAATQSVIDTNRYSEEISKQALMGKAEIADVVTAVAHAETTLQTIVTVRDKVISAYQEILRMPI